MHGKILTPTLPEWLPGGEGDQEVQNPTTYLPIAAGKPFYRDYPKGNPEAATRNREILRPRRADKGIIPGHQRIAANIAADRMQSPIVMFDGRNQNAGQNCGPNLPGCQSRLSHAVDLLATMREVSGTATQTCPPPGVDCINYCPDSRPDQKSRYEGITLTNVAPRPCDIPSTFSAYEEQIFRQCMVGRKHGSGQTTSCPTTTTMNRRALLASRLPPNDRNLDHTSPDGLMLRFTELAIRG